MIGISLIGDKSQPSETLGPSVIKRLLDAGFTVTALTRDPNETVKKYSPKSFNTILADYGSVDGFEATLQARNIDAVVCLINRSELQAQTNLVDACIAAGISHIIPSSFGNDLRDPALRGLPSLKQKGEIEDYLNERAREGAITFTIINAGLFIDRALDANFFLNLKDGSAIRIFDGGDTKVSVTVLEDVGRAVASALQRRDQLVNSYCSIHSAVVTQNQLLGYAKELCPRRKYTTIDLNTLEMVEVMEGRLEDGHEMSAGNGRAYLLREMFGKGTLLFQSTQNETLGIHEWDENRLKDLVAKYVRDD
ncbi:Hypothetical predicted protein [Lecanosticta acicola]|uniref:NmrA-like domain-containing protein n=1 Tax=Lecanosticta acicola TaxID=111012 RepID=A0AAI8YYH1_9PEZI|nr:Hypothetical predicted protein [Lecanosticta acicola]